MINLIHIVGRKNSGKTTLIVELVRQLAGNGLQVGTIKHTHHVHELDTPGKDSYRHRQAGAAVSAIMTPDTRAVFWPRRFDREDPYHRILATMDHCDIVLVEGHLAGPGVNVEVWRAAVGDVPLAETDGSIVAVISNDRPSVGVPVWARSDVPALAKRLVEFSSGTCRWNSGPDARPT